MDKIIDALGRNATNLAFLALMSALALSISSYAYQRVTFDETSDETGLTVKVAGDKEIRERLEACGPDHYAVYSHLGVVFFWQINEEGFFSDTTVKTFKSSEDMFAACSVLKSGGAI